MHLTAIDALSGQRAALTAPPAERMDRFREAVMEPLRPFWEPFMSRMPRSPAEEPPADPAIEAARAFGYYSPELESAAGLAALDRLERAGVWPACLAALERAWEALAPVDHGVTLDAVRFTLLLGDPRVMPAKAGHYTGFGGTPGLVMVMVWPTDFNLPRLPAAAAHELNHNVRFSVEPFLPWAVTVGQYLVAEGLAEAFAAELHGEEMVGPWANAIAEADLAPVKARFRDALEVSGFDQVRGYLFGDWSAEQFGHTRLGLPDFAGYTIGYHLVRAYLARTGQTAAAATYVPWREIVAGSAYL